MARPKRIRDGVVSSIYIEGEFKKIAKSCNLSDSDLWLDGLKYRLGISNTRQGNEKLLQILQVEHDRIEEQINIIKDKLGKISKRIKVKDYGSDEVYEVDENDYDPKNQRKIK